MAAVIVLKRQPGFWMPHSQVCEPQPNIEVLPSMELRFDKAILNRRFPKWPQIFAAPASIRLKYILE